jgi:hypothetical protein
MLRTASSLPLAGLLTLGSGPARFQTGPPACYRASWQLPGPDFHRQATTSLRTRRSTMALGHGVTSCSAGRTRKPQCTLVAVRRDDPDAVATYAGPVNQFLGPMSGLGNFGLSAWQFEQLTVIIDSDFRTSHA